MKICQTPGHAHTRYTVRFTCCSLLRVVNYKRSRKIARGLERLGIGFDILRLWIGQAWRIGMLMAKGAYLLGERRRLFLKLGEETYRKYARGEVKAPPPFPEKDGTDSEIVSTMKQVDRLTKKVELEEMLIQSVRFGERSRSKASRSEQPEDEEL